ncbi:hypothetical protein [Pseudoalteromonas umbrosa]|uniref:hypothetical protein n=1 Tax=Pseudoalteromonas umbrosa TaxID=3048489 RepID=UPI0024C341AF|nr:hypothetical protein [Pseudoalteromonas sp. B95]MDK1286843.1 hypothetical protein [Pseudoalteromonas sp. B95]
MKIQLALVLILIALITLAWQPAKTFLLQDSCLDQGGKWASNGNFCIYQNCAETSSCKPSYRNNSICEELKSGISQDELYFHLGMPESRSDNNFVFTAGGGEKEITATIMSGKVVKLQCGT